MALSMKNETKQMFCTAPGAMMTEELLEFVF